MGPECQYSFKDLYIAAFGRTPEDSEMTELFALSQKERNQQVKRWAESAGWGTEDRAGTGGQFYTAYCPLWERTR